MKSITLTPVQLYTKLFDAINKRLNNTPIYKAPADFPVKRGMYSNIKRYIAGNSSMSDKLYNPQRLEELCKEFNVCEKVEKQTFFNIS